MTVPPIVLASASPARRRLLQMVGIDPIVLPSHFDESQVQSNDPQELVQTLAQEKAKIIVSKVENSLILGCDSVLAVDGQIYGKPDNAEEAMQRWRFMRGQRGFLYTGHALIDQTQKKSVVRCGITKVLFANISDRTIQAYVTTQEPLNCAGSFALEGRGGLFVEHLEGCHSNVIGLSLPLLRQMLTDLEYEVTDFW